MAEPPKRTLALEELEDTCNDPLQVGDCCEAFEEACKGVLAQWFPKGRDEETLGEEFGELLEDYKDAPNIARCPCKQVLQTSTASAQKLLEFESSIASWNAPLSVVEKRRQFDDMSKSFTDAMVQFNKYMVAFRRLEDKDKASNACTKRKVRTRKRKYATHLEGKGVPASLAKVLGQYVFSHDEKPDVGMTCAGAIDFTAVDDEGPYMLESFDRPRAVNLPHNFVGLGGVLKKLCEANRVDLTKIHDDGISTLKVEQKQKNATTGKQEKIVSRHCFKSFKLKQAFSWTINENCSLSEFSCERGISRIFECERFSMNPESFALHATAGLIVVLKGTVSIVVLDRDSIASEMDIGRYLSALNDDSLNDECICIAEEGRAVWVPFGHVAVMVGMASCRSTLSANTDSRGRPKQTGKDAPEREFVQTLWLSCHSSDNATMESYVRNSVMARLQSQKSSLPPSFENLGSWQTWHSIMLAAAAEDEKKKNAAQGE